MRPTGQTTSQRPVENAFCNAAVRVAHFREVAPTKATEKEQLGRIEKKHMFPHLDLAMEGMEGTKAEAVAAVARAKIQEDFMIMLVESGVKGVGCNSSKSSGEGARETFETVRGGCRKAKKCDSSRGGGVVVEQ